MSRKIAGLLFLAVCVIIAILLLLKAVTPLVGGSLFAVALVTLGALSGGFRRA